MLRGLEAFLRRSQGSVQNMNRSQELGVLHEDSEVESKTGQIVIVLVEI